MSEAWWPAYVTAGEVVYPPGGTYGPRIQLDHQLVMLHTGRLTLTVDNQSQHFEAGIALLLAPGHTEFFRFADDSFTRHSWIASHGSELPAQWMATLGALPHAIPLSQQMCALAQQAVHWMHAMQSNSLLCSIGHHALSLFLRESMDVSEAPSLKHEAVYMSQQYIRRHYSEDLSLQDLSQHCAVSAEYLCRLYRSQCGTTPMAYLWGHRTKQALNLLAATGLSVADIARRCGFKSQFHLCKKVRALTGLSPTECRTRNWANTVSHNQATTL